MTDFLMRPYQDDDLDAMIEVIEAVMRHDGEEGRFPVEDARHQLQAPFLNPDRDFFTVTTPEGRVIGLTLVFLNPRTGQGIGTMFLHPDYWDSDLPATMLKRGDDHLEKLVKMEVDTEKPAWIIRSAREKHGWHIDTLKNQGYQEVRRSYQMRIALDDLPAVTLPDGLELRPFVRDEHIRAVYEAQQESFRDHWGHVEDTPLEDWVYRLDAPDHDPALFIIAWDGDEVAGVSLCGRDNGREDMAWVHALGVRRPWRKRGLGSALLQHSFQVFKDKGFDIAALGVDALSKTNAVALYERAGMHVHSVSVQFIKMLRGNLDDIDL